MDFLIEVLGSVLLFLLSLVGVALRQYVLTKVNNSNLRAALTRMTDASLGAVASVAQEYADALKRANADGKLTPEERDHARSMALERMKSLLGEVGLQEVQRVFGLYGASLDSALLSRLESALLSLKKGLKP